MRATAQLPGLEVEIVHRRSPAGDREQISITMQAVPSFAAFEQYWHAMNPFVLWAEAVRLAWTPFVWAPVVCAPWLQAARATTLPFVDSPRLTRTDPQAEADKPE
jgi:hypothetical protein